MSPIRSLFLSYLSLLASLLPGNRYVPIPFDLTSTCFSHPILFLQNISSSFLALLTFPCQNEQIRNSVNVKESSPASVKVCLGTGPSTKQRDYYSLTLTISCPTNPRFRHKSR